MSTNSFDTIVVGAGALGTATAYWLSKQGQTSVLVLEQFALGHSKGGSEDHSRIIRHSYHSSTYGRLTQASYDNWAQLERESGQQIVWKTGGLDIAIEGTDGVESVEGYRKTLIENGHDFEKLNKQDLVDRWPQWNITEGQVNATYQKDSGILDIRRACQTHIALAQSNGVTFKENTPVIAIEENSDGVKIITSAETYTANKVVLCTASWADQLLKPMGQIWSTTISQEQVAYLVPKNLKDYAIGKFPLWVWHGQTMFYGFPVYGEVAVKVSRDVTGRFVTHSTRSFTPIREETDLLIEFVKDKLPTAYQRELYSKTCVYDMPPDREFILDYWPGKSRIIVGFGAGHAAKFAGLIGEILADLVITGSSIHPIDAFSASRAALNDRNFTPTFVLKG
ncbi:MAG: N-methyl-L-tryptophan oxidase [Gordonia sp. (in: high G+C Gram-positive bacteria)]